MKEIITSSLIFTLTFFITACQPTSNVNSNISSPVPHNAVNHNVFAPMNSNTTNSNSMNNNSVMNHNSMSADSANHDDMRMESSPDAANQPYDLQFIDTMIQHHQAAIVMAKMVLANSQNQDLRKFAQKIITDQEAEIEQMESWRDAWYPYKLDAVNMELPGMKDSMKQMVGAEMDKMQNAEGREFENYFLQMMIPHHQGAVTMAKDALQKAEHPDLKSLAQEIITAQEAEIKQMTDWREKVKGKR